MIVIKKSQIAAQLYTARDHMKNASEVEETLKKIKAIGYQAVELPGLPPLEAGQWKELLDRYGLACCAIHIGDGSLLENPESAGRTLEQLGCSCAVLPFPRGVSFDSEESVKTMAQALSSSGRMLRDKGYALLYHNHNIEFLRFRQSPWLEYIFQWTDRRSVQAELDVYWVQVGGGNPESWCRKLKGRLPILHLKDCGVDREREPVFKEIGQGNLEWKAILGEAKRSGCQWYVVEQDGNWINSDPFEALGVSWDYLSRNFC
jgi:sugar phosphate isomerase/epimerase